MSQLKSADYMERIINYEQIGFICKMQVDLILKSIKVKSQWILLCWDSQEKNHDCYEYKNAPDKVQRLVI